MNAGGIRVPRGFRSALADGATVALIAEVKRRSPGAGPIRPDLDPIERSRSRPSRRGGRKKQPARGEEEEKRQVTHGP